MVLILILFAWYPLCEYSKRVKDSWNKSARKTAHITCRQQVDWLCIQQMAVWSHVQLCAMLIIVFVHCAGQDQFELAISLINTISYRNRRMHSVMHSGCYLPHFIIKIFWMIYVFLIARAPKVLLASLWLVSHGHVEFTTTQRKIHF